MRVIIKNDNGCIEKYKNVVQINKSNKNSNKSNERTILSLINKENGTKYQYLIKSDQIQLITE